MAASNESDPAATIAALKETLDALRPASAAALANLERWYDVELTYTSNAIEGNTLTRQETAIVLEKGITIAGKTLREHMEALDHAEALRTMREMARADRLFDESDVLKLHGIVMYRSNPGVAGRYADLPRRIAGSRVVLPSPRKIPGLMATLGQRLALASGWADAFEAHYGLVTVHPFADGNGRTARLLMNLVLLRNGYPAVLIGPEQRADYLAVLETRQMAEPLGHDVVDAAARERYLGFMAARLIASLEDHIRFLTVEP